MIVYDYLIILFPVIKSQGSEQMKAPEKLYEGNMHKKYLLFAIPLILSGFLSQSYNFINSMMIGKHLGSDAFAATAVTAELLQLFSSVLWGYLTGIGIYVSILFGKGDYEKMRNIIKINFMFSTVFALLVSVGCNLFCPQIFDILNVNDEIYKDAERYFRTYVCGYPILQLTWGFMYIANGMGLTKVPLIASIVTGVINVFLNYLFLSVWGKGIHYSALATAIASAITLIAYLIIFARLFKNLNIPLKGFSVCKEDLKFSVDYGMPTMLQQMTMYACTTLVSPLINTCTTAALSGYTIANKGRNLITTIYQNSSKANTTCLAQAMGAGKINKIKEGIRIGFTLSLLLSGVFMSLLLIFAREFTSLFLDPVKDAESFTVSVNIIWFLLPFLLFNVVNNLFHGIFRAVGSGKLMFISTMIYAVSYVIYAYIFFAILPFDMRIYGVHLALSGAYITEVIFAAVIYFAGKWKSAEYKNLENQNTHML